MKIKLFVMMSMLVASYCMGAVIVSEQFGGLGTANLGGTTADIFDASIVTAGGNSTWVLQNNSYIRADGSFVIPAGNNAAAYLDLGSLIDDAKGNNEGGRFILQATFTGLTQGAAGIGFKHLDSTAAFWTDGVATAIQRAGTWNNTDPEFYAYHDGVAGSFQYTTTFTQTLKVELDFTGYDDVTNFGTVKFYDPANMGSVLYSYDYTSGISIRGIAINYGDGAQGDTIVSNFTLTQLDAVPEPGTAGLFVVALSLLAFHRRRLGFKEADKRS